MLKIRGDKLVKTVLFCRSLSTGNESVKRKRSEDEECGGKRRSEEPLVRIKKPFVDETVVDEVETEKKNVVKTISEKTLIEKVLNEEIVVIKNGENGAKDISADVTKALNGLDEISVSKLSGDPKVKALRVDVKNVHDKEKEVRNYLMALPLANFEDEEEEEEEEADPYEVEEILEFAFCKEDQVRKDGEIDWIECHLSGGEVLREVGGLVQRHQHLGARGQPGVY